MTVTTEQLSELNQVNDWDTYFDGLAEWAKGKPYFFEGYGIIGEYDKDAECIDAVAIYRDGRITRSKVFFGKAALKAESALTATGEQF